MGWYQAIIIALIGITAGMLGGMLGLGGAIIIIPAMVMLLGYSQQSAQGTALLMMVLPVGSMAAWQYYQKGFVDIRAALLLGLFFFIGGFFGAGIATQIPGTVLRKSFALLLIALGAKLLFFTK